MKDQAENLRQIIINLNGKQKQNIINTPDNITKKTSKVISITSGKGGVGKTNIAVNLALALGDSGKRVVILDADLGLSNIDILLGVTPKHTLADVIYNNKNILDVISRGPNNIGFISGGSGIEGLVKLKKNDLDNFIYNIALLDRIADIVLIDTGAGLSDNVMQFVMASDEVIMVTTPEPTSITDAYALIKMISTRDRKKQIKLIVNRAENIKEAKDITDKISFVVRRFLNIELIPLGHILQDNIVVKSVKLQNPFFLSYPKSNVAQSITEISKKIGNNNSQSDTKELEGIKGFVNKFIEYMKG